MSVRSEVLADWNRGATRQAVLEFVERTVSGGVPVEKRVAVFENDGTLWCEPRSRRRGSMKQVKTR